MKKILFISYDGMTDPLGQSQVLPYLAGLSQKGYSFTLLSCEKKERFEKNKAIIEAITQKYGIDWQPIPFTSSPPVLAKYFDLYQLEKKAFQLHREKKFDMVHCRSYVSAAVGQKMKEKFGIPFFFDMRGFWVDERVDGGNWNLSNPLYKLAYRTYKKKEAGYISDADVIVSLTEAGKREMSSWKSYRQAPIGVIPCSADFDHFVLADEQRKSEARKLLGYRSSDLVISYLGSIGMWYMLDEMLAFFAQLKKRYPEAKFLFITPEPAEMVLNKIENYGLKPEDFLIRSATRQEVPLLTAASDLNIFFIKQSYSKIASSPTKLGEVLALGIPVICNSNVGDVKEIVEDVDAGIALPDFSKESFEKAIAMLPQLLSRSGAGIREKALKHYKLENAIEKYHQLYQTVLK